MSGRRYAKERLDKKVVSSGAYDGPAEFARDMQLVFDNCALYNTPQSDAGMAVLDITQSNLQLDSHPALSPNQPSSWTLTQPTQSNLQVDSPSTHTRLLIDVAALLSLFEERQRDWLQSSINCD